MKTRNFLDALSREHEDTDGAGIGRMDRRVRALEPAIEAHEFLIV